MLQSLAGFILLAQSSALVAAPPLRTEVQKLIAPAGSPGERFGIDVAVSGKIALVGALRRQEGDSGAVYVFQRLRRGDWAQVDRIEPCNAAAGSLFGARIAFDGQTALVGRIPLATGIGNGVCTFVREGNTWRETQVLAPLEPQPGEAFGVSVALNQKTALIGAPEHDGAGTNSGAVYVFTKSLAGWSESAMLLPTDGSSDAGFGSAVSLRGDVAVIGASGADGKSARSGAAYVFVRRNGVWAEQQKLVSPDGAAGDTFGRAVALDGNNIAIGADSHHSHLGAVYVFSRNKQGAWNLRQKISRSDGEPFESFGAAVALRGDFLIASTPFDNDPVLGDDFGSVYVFRRINGKWVERSKLVASDGDDNDFLGTALAASNTALLVGAYASGIGNDDFNAPGAAYIFEMGR